MKKLKLKIWTQISMDIFPFQALLHTTFATYINNKNSTKFIVSLCWCVGAICLLASMFAKLQLQLNAVKIIHMYIIQVYHAFIITTFVMTYLYIYYRYRMDKRGLRSRYGSRVLNAYKVSIASNSSSQRGTNDTPGESQNGRKKKISDANSRSTTTKNSVRKKSSDANSRSTTKKSSVVSRKLSEATNFRSKTRKHVMTFCIMMTYVLFVMVPEFLHYSIFHGAEFVRTTSPMSLASMVLFVFAGLSECLLYIFMDTRTRERFIELITCRRNGNVRNRILHSCEVHHVVHREQRSSVL